MHFAVVLFGGRHRQMALPDARSWGRLGSVSWFYYYHHVILADSSVFCFEYSIYKVCGGGNIL